VRAVVGARRNDGRAAIVGIVVQSCETAERARGFAVDHEVGVRERLADSDRDQLFSQHGVRETSRQFEGRKECGRGAHVIGSVTPLADAASIASKPLPGTVGAANHSLELIDGVLHQIARVEHQRGTKARFERGRQFIDSRVSGPFRTQRAREPVDRGMDPLVVGNRGGFDKQGQPRRASTSSRVVIGQCQRLSQCQTEHVLQRRGVSVGIEIAAQDQRRRGGVGRFTGSDRGCDERRHLLQFGDPGILQARNYNEEMIVVRYATLVALVIWIAAMVDERFPDVLHRTLPMTYVCGAATVVGLFMLKFLGPPPIAFVMRAGIAVLMLAIGIASAFIAPRDSSNLLMIVNIGLGLVLLIWYVRE